MKVAKGMVFGVFDGLHEGHQHFLRDAASRCDALTVVVAHDAAVARIKGRLPKRPLSARIAAIRAFDPALTIVSGDEAEGEWTVLTPRPNMVLLGYDQKGLAEELDRLGIPHTSLNPHEPERFKSGLLDA